MQLGANTGSDQTAAQRGAGARTSGSVNYCARSHLDAAGEFFWLRLTEGVAMVSAVITLSMELL